MATITDGQGQAVSRETQIDAMVASGIPREYAKFIVAVEAGETPGDVVMLDEDGNEVREERTDVD